MLFLGNIQPDLQRQVRAQCAGARFAALDSMNLWIETASDSLLAAIAEVDCLLAQRRRDPRMLTGEPNLARAARAVMEHGPARRRRQAGEYGAALFTGDGFFALPGLPARGRPRPDRRRRQLRRRLPRLPRRPRRRASTSASLRRAMAYGTVLASFNVEDFGTERVARLTREEIDERFAELHAMTHFEPLPGLSRVAPGTAGAQQARQLRDCDTGTLDSTELEERRWPPSSRLRTRPPTAGSPARRRVADRHRQPHRQDLRARRSPTARSGRWTCARSRSTRTTSG